MIGALELQRPLAFQLGLGAAGVILLLSAWSLWRRRLPLIQAVTLLLLRGAALLAISFFCGWPVRQTETAAATRRSVAVLVDRSESMTLTDAGPTRYALALAFARGQLLPALAEAQLDVGLYRFAEDSERIDGASQLDAPVAGRQTNLARAILRAVGDPAVPPLAVVALTDGAANQPDENVRAVSALTDLGVPFIGVGFGSDRGTPTLTLRGIDAPAEVPPESEFTLTAQLEATGNEAMVFDLLLLRDGQLRDTHRIEHRGARPFTDAFHLSEPSEGVHHYEARLVPSAASPLRYPAIAAQAAVRVVKAPALRVLYVQGALTWDYKFVATALRDDPAIQLTGLTRTAEQSIFRQNVESAGELLDGFPTSIEQLAPFRAVVLSSVHAGDLSPAQQELLVRFCGELGGGILVIGGEASFDASWHGSRLEDVLPIVFPAVPAATALDQPFHLELTAEALRHQVFQLGDDTMPASVAWGSVPAFSRYARVDGVKPGAEIWMRHPVDDGRAGRRALMAVQRYGAGLSAALMVEAFWRWRLAKDTDPAAFDRFWRQLLRHLGQAGSAEVAIGFNPDAPAPQSNVRISLERQQRPGNVAAGAELFEVRIELVSHESTSPPSKGGTPGGSRIQTQRVELAPARPVELTFRPDDAALYRVSVQGPNGVLAATRTIEVRNTNVELQETARDMEHLRQWAALSNGLAVPAEECATGRALIERVRQAATVNQRRLPQARPVRFDGVTLTVLVLTLGTEWLLRKAWGLR